ncbi:MAG: hypothetical protein WBE34_17330 [Candidatus Nitrosopolaris sp.]
MQAKDESSRLTSDIIQKFEYRAISMPMMMVRFLTIVGYQATTLGISGGPRPISNS